MFKECRQDFTFGKVSIKWYEDGVLNASVNCIDRHLADRALQTAIIFEPDDPETPAQHITYRELHEKVCRFANALKALGAKQPGPEWAVEIEALRNVFAASRSAQTPLLLGSVKTNIGHLEAGAGVAGHIHLHILPRWLGDVSFMTTVGQTRIMPEDLPETFARLKPVLNEVLAEQR